MDDFLTPIKTTKKVQSNIEKFESLSSNDSRKEAQPVGPSTTKSKGSILEIDPLSDDEPIIIASKPPPGAQSLAVRVLKESHANGHKRHDSTVFLERSYLKEPASPVLPDNAREILKYQPDHEDLLAVLQYLQFGIEGRHDFDVRRTSAKAAQIVNILVTVTVPDLWTNLGRKELSEEEARIKRVIVSSLSSVAGIGALLTQIKQSSNMHSARDLLRDTIVVLGDTLKGHKTLDRFLENAEILYEKESTRRIFWQEITALLAGSRVLSIVSEAFDRMKPDTDDLLAYRWIGDGTEYTKWLANNIVNQAVKLNASREESWKFLSQMVKRGLSLGHRDIFVAELYAKLLLGQRALWTPLHLIIRNLAPHEQKVFFDCVLSDLAHKYLAPAGGPEVAYTHDSDTQRAVAGAAALIAGMVKNNDILKEYVEQWLTNGNASATTIGLPARRAMVAAFGQLQDVLQSILEKSLINFSDKLQIQHTSMLQQEATAQVILLAIGHLSRIDGAVLKHVPISTYIMHAVSNRLAASIPRTRLLGMIIGTAFSRLTDKPENTINFGTEEMQSEDVKTWLGLVFLNDRVGDITDLQNQKPPISATKRAYKQLTPVPLGVKQSQTSQLSKIIAIEEVSSSTDSEDDDMVPYQKPDSDPEDSDEDPTLINRSKPSAPVYIVDLIKQLQSNEKPDIVSLALGTAPSLIRRKAAFGTEVSDNIRTLITVLVNLQEGMSQPDLQELRLDSLIACVVAKADLVGPSLADLYFRGDFSIYQRITILTAFGLGCRDLAGFKDDRSASGIAEYPSKRLPAHLQPASQQQLLSTQNAVAMLTDTVAHETIRPMALAAADQVTGPSVLKIRTFSSRLEVEKKNKEKSAARTKSIPKNLHKLLAESTYIPLCSRMSLLLSHAMGGRLPNTTILHSSTMRLFCQTLTLVLHTLGPSASLHLSTLTHETLLLLLNLHNITSLSLDPAILPALLHLLLALLDITIEAGVTAQERLITDFGVQLTELVNWSNSIGGKISVPDAEGQDGGISWKVLAAGVQVKWFEIGKRFQSRMLGLSMDEMDQLAGV